MKRLILSSVVLFGALPGVSFAEDCADESVIGLQAILGPESSEPSDGSGSDEA